MCLFKKKKKKIDNMLMSTIFFLHIFDNLLSLEVSDKNFNLKFKKIRKVVSSNCL